VRAREDVAGGGFDEPRELAWTFAVRMVAHLFPDAELRLWERGDDTVVVGERDEPVAVAPERQDRPVVVKPAAVKRAVRPKFPLTG
jgi:hypothetical protein